ncbi:HAD family hydrolase [Pelagibius sp. 7325]|uniref:HAD family hydrolase n=1 Tax=Pelagibius sp. 7325 TaxID=3131994 RepID=UPI0030EF644C
MSLPAPKAILFDWDNTLVDSWAVIHHAMTATFHAMGQRPWTLEETRQNVRQSARDSFPRLFGERADEATKVFYRTYEADHLSQLRALPGAGEMLAALAAADDLLLGVVSNKRGDILRLESAELGWDRFFSTVVGATDAACDKPSPEVVDFALRGSGIAAGPAVWFVGDTDIDILCARNAGCTAILLRAEAPGAEEFDGRPLGGHVADCAAFSELTLKVLAQSAGSKPLKTEGLNRK